MKSMRCMTLRIRPAQLACLGCLLLGLAGATACGSSPTQPAESPSRPDSGNAPEPAESGPAPASSSKVKEAIQAIQAQDFARAKELLTAARAESAKDPQAAFYLGVAEQGLGNGEAAIQAFQEALKLDPKLTEASINLSAALLETGEQDQAKEALEVISQALKTAPQSADLIMNQAVAKVSLGDFAGAARAYAKVVAQAPKDQKLRLEYARVLGKAGQKDQALTELGELGKSEEPLILIAAGNVHGQLGDFKGCVAVLDKVIQKKPTAEPYVRRGACKKELGDKPGALGDYQQAIKLDEQYAPAHLYLGRHLFFESKKNKEALVALEKAQKLGAGTPIAAEAEKTIAQIKGGKK
jgi:Flp pilus assembly protein TadD